MKKAVFDFGCLFLLLLFLIIFFWPVIFENKTFVTSGMVMSDLMNQNYPFKVVYAQVLKEGRLPFWVAKMGDGFPLVAEGQVGAFYPFNLLLFYFLSPLLAFNLSLVFHYFLAGLFIYLLARDEMKLSPLASLVASLTFSLSGFLLIHLVHLSLVQTVAWLPLQLWLLEKILRQPRFWQIIPLSLVFTCQFLAGHPEIFYFSVLFLGVYVILRLFFRQGRVFQQAWRPILVLTGAALITAMVCLPQLGETWRMVGFSNRAQGFTYEETTGYLFPLRHFLTLVVPWLFDFIEESLPPAGRPEMTNLWETYLYVGLIPLFLALSSLFLQFKQEPKVRFFAGLLVFSLFLALGRSTPLFRIFWNLVPGMKLFKYPTRFLVFTTFGLSFLAGFGLEMGLRKIRSAQLRQGVGLILTLIIFGDLFLVQRRINPTDAAQDWLALSQSAQFLKENLGEHRFYTLGTANIDYLSTRDLKAQKGLQELLPGDFNLIYGLSSANDQAAFFLDRHTKLSKNTPEGRLKFNQEGSFTIPDERLKVFSLEGVKYVLSALPLENKNLTQVKKIPLAREVNYTIPQLVGTQVEVQKFPTQTVYIYENTQVLPRAWLVYRVRDLSSQPETRILEGLVAEDFDPRREVILEEEFIGGLEGKEGGKEGKVEIVNYEDQKIEIKVTSSADGLLVLTDNFYPGWRAFVDGQPTKVYLANFSFRAVVVPRGEHTVEFRYQPWL